MTGTTIEYVYAELQVVESCVSEANDPLVGHYVTALRVNMGRQAPSTVLMLDMKSTYQLLADLQKIVEEHKRAIEADEDGSDQSFPGSQDA